MSSAVSQSQNWQAFLALELRQGQDKTRLVPIKRYGPLSVQRAFYPEQGCCHVYLLHPPGGVVGGDRLELHIDSGRNSEALITTPGANKFYLSAGDTAHVEQHFDLHQDSCFEYLPQENIYFPGAKVRAFTRVDISDNSRAMIWEKHCFGRPVNQELFSQGQVITELQLIKNQKLLFTEKQRIDVAEIKRASGLRGYPVIGSFLMVADQIDLSLIDSCREITPEDGISGVTQPRDGLVVVRYLGHSTADVNRFFIRIWEQCRSAIIGRQANHPRIWNT